MRAKAVRLAGIFLDALWAFAMLSLPFTSLPLFTGLTGSLVAPLSAVPVFILLVIWLLPLMLKRASLPKETEPLLYFGLAAVASTALAAFLIIPGFKGKSVFGQELRALFTLAVGVVFYLVFSAWPRDERRLKQALIWLNAGGAIAVAFGLAQGYFMYFNSYQFPDWFWKLQDSLVLISPFIGGKVARVSSLTYEPSWFAHQLVVLYFPIWMAASYLRVSSFRARLLRLSVENILLAGGLAAFVLSKPRIGAIALLLSLGLLFLMVNLALYRKLVSPRLARFPLAARSRLIRRLVGFVWAAAWIAACVAAVTGLAFAGARFDKRLVPLIQNPIKPGEVQAVLNLDETTIIRASNRFQFMERMVYWVTGWHVFNDHPWFGVGLGNTGFFTLQDMPLIGWASYEVRSLVYNSYDLPNTKCFWVRLLSETGLVGFAIFLTWYFLLWRSARHTRRSRKPTLRILALAGQMSLLAFIVEGFSIDTFALPYLWAAAGFISAAGFLYRQDCRLEAAGAAPSAVSMPEALAVQQQEQGQPGQAAGSKDQVGI